MTTTTESPSIKDLKFAMGLEVNHLSGINKAIDACVRIYSTDFRSEPEKLSIVEGWEDEAASLKVSLAVLLYVADGNVPPEMPDDDEDVSEDDEDQYYAYCDSCYAEMRGFKESAVAWCNDEHPGIDITGDTLVVHICNYKGEGEGFELYETHKHLPVFVSKEQSFYQAN